MEMKIKHLEMIESVIQRQADNGFKIKAFGAGLVSILAAIGDKKGNIALLLFAILFLLMLWFLDAFYLQTERKYVALYKHVLSINSDKIDFSMDANKIVQQDEDFKRLKYFSCMRAKPELLFYITLLSAVILYTCNTLFGWL